MKLNHSQAAKVVGVTRKTLYTHVNNGKVSQEQDADGNPQYDVSELIRAYPALNMDALNTSQDNKVDTNQSETPLKNSLVDTEIQVLQQEIAELRAKASEAEKFRELYQQEKERRERAERQEDESRELIKVMHRQLPAPAEVKPEPEPQRRKFLGIF